MSAFSFIRTHKRTHLQTHRFTAQKINKNVHAVNIYTALKIVSRKMRETSEEYSILVITVCPSIKNATYNVFSDKACLGLSVKQVIHFFLFSPFLKSCAVAANVLRKKQISHRQCADATPFWRKHNQSNI